MHSILASNRNIIGGLHADRGLCFSNIKQQKHASSVVNAVSKVIANRKQIPLACWALPGREPGAIRPSLCRAGSPSPTGKVPSEVAYCRWIRSEKDQPSRWSERWKFVLFDDIVRWRWDGNKKRQGKTQRVKTGQGACVCTALKQQDMMAETGQDYPLHKLTRTHAHTYINIHTNLPFLPQSSGFSFFFLCRCT